MLSSRDLFRIKKKKKNDLDQERLALEKIVYRTEKKRRFVWAIHEGDRIPIPRASRDASEAERRGERQPPYLRARSRRRARDLPANRILMRSSGCSIRVETTPPEMPATKYSYLKLLRTLSWRGVPGAPLSLIAVMFHETLLQLLLLILTLALALSCRSPFTFVTDPVIIVFASSPMLAMRACTRRHISWSTAGTVVELS